MDAVYVLYVNEFLGPYDLPVTARERAAESFMTDEEYRRKQNTEALKQMGIIK